MRRQHRAGSEVIARAISRRATDAQPTDQYKTVADIALRGASFTGTEEVDDSAWSGESVALGWRHADIERGFKLAAELDHVEGISTKVVDKRRIQPQSGRRKVEVPRDDGLDPTLD